MPGKDCSVTHADRAPSGMRLSFASCEVTFNRMGNVLLRATTRLVGMALIVSQTAFAAGRAKPVVTYTSPCTCEGNHGVSRWAAKTDLAEPPGGSANIKSIAPSQMSAWQGIGGGVTQRSRRLIAEENWFSVTGRVETVRIEDDGDLHIVLRNADAQHGGIVVELPLGPRWCEMRKTVFSWTDAHFPVSPGKSDKFALAQHPIVTVLGKAFYDIDHSGNDTRSNRRNYDPSLAVWEIHPVMRLAVGNAAPPASVTAAAPTPPISESTPASVAPPPATIPQPTAAPEQFVTITQPVTVEIPHGTTVLQPGIRLPILSRDSQSVDVRYLDARYAIPISSTNLK
jgi:hypothetical protein